MYIFLVLTPIRIAADTTFMPDTIHQYICMSQETHKYEKRPIGVSFAASHH